MKTILTALFALLISSAAFAQNAYIVSVCGNVGQPSPNGAFSPVTILTYSGMAFTVTPDSLGDFCVSFDAPQDSGIYANIQYSLSYEGCGVLATKSFGWFQIDSDTTFFSSIYACTWENPDSCQVQFTQLPAIYDNTVVLSANYYGTEPVSFQWDFGDGTFDNDMLTFEKFYFSTDTFTVCFSITDAVGCVAQYCEPVVPFDSINNPTSCYAYYEFYPGNTFSELIFVGGCTGTAPFSYVWDFGDGSALDNNAQTSHVFSDSAYYMVCLMVTDATGCVSEYCNYVSTENNDSTVVTACEVFVYYSAVSDSLNNPSGNEFVFYAYPNGVPPFTYNWSFSDGSMSTSENPIHVFSSSNGWDWVCLEITDAMGCSSSYCTYVEISDSSFAYCYTGFEAYFEDANGIPGEVFFYDFSASTGNIVEWNWSFDDGAMSTLQNPSHVFQQAGYYNVCLQTLDNTGCLGEWCNGMYIDPTWWSSNPWSPNGANCSAQFLSVEDSSVGGLLYLVDLSYGANLTYTWDFGNGMVINDRYPFVTFTSADPVYVCLTILDTVSGCTDTFCETVALGANATNKSSNWGISVIPSPKPKSVTSVEEKSAEKVLSTSVYPNPAKDFFMFSMNVKEASSLQLELFDLTGQVVVSQNTQTKEGVNQVNFSTEGVSSGVYFLQVKGENTLQLEKITVLK